MIKNWTRRKLMDWWYGKPDYTIKKGDIVTTKNWTGTALILDVNWALRAAAVELAPGKGIVVWPVGGMRKEQSK